LLRELPPGTVARRAVDMVRRRLAASRDRRRDLARGTYALDVPAATPQPICDPVPRGKLEPHREGIRHAAEEARAHRFDLLGSGLVQVKHGMECRGIEATRYPPASAAPINVANRQESDRIRALIDPGYAPIDWQIDFRSGFRWREDTWSFDVVFDRLDNVDIKVPWELARMQHLVPLALAHRLAGAEAEACAREFRNQVLDFIAANPPRFGVNWRVAMEVGIRAANWAAAYGLFRAHGARFDAAFEAVLARSLAEHARHIEAHLEIYPEGRANHYFADVAGLLFAAAALPPGAQRDGWLDFAAGEIEGETRFQFNDDGSNFEGSTGYHGLTLEMARASTALRLGLGRAPDAEHFARLDRAGEFVADLTKSDGRIVPIGDDDSGRFLGRDPALEEVLFAALARGNKPPIAAERGRAARVRIGTAPPSPTPNASTTIIVVPGGRLRDGLALRGYPDFGIWIFRSPRLFLAVRCGPSSAPRAGGSHAHNDQLAVVLAVDGEDWIVDPGSYLYCPPDARRNAYRSVTAHAAPRWPGREPAPLHLAKFFLPDHAKARCLYFGEDGFVGEHVGYGTPVRRIVMLRDDEIAIHDQGLPGAPQTMRLSGRAEVRRHFAPPVPVAIGYGRLKREAA
jgi:hypothetical protein